MLARFREWGWDASIESFTVLFPTPKERVLELLGISPGPTRLKCALLPLKAFKLALYSHLGKMMDEKEEREIEEADEGAAAGQAADEEAGK